MIALLLGSIGGGIIGLALVQPRTSLVSEFLYFIGFLFWFIGFLFWHCGVAAALFGRPRTTGNNRPRRTAL